MPFPRSILKKSRAITRSSSEARARNLEAEIAQITRILRDFVRPKMPRHDMHVHAKLSDGAAAPAHVPLASPPADSLHLPVAEV
jgi:hypothetical protein